MKLKTKAKKSPLVDPGKLMNFVLNPLKISINYGIYHSLYNLSSYDPRYVLLKEKNALKSDFILKKKAYHAAGPQGRMGKVKTCIVKRHIKG